MKGLAILGSTGSIGRSALDVVRRWPDRFKVVTLCAGSNIDLLAGQVSEFRPVFVSVTSERAARELAQRSGLKASQVGFGAQGAGLAASFEGVDTVLSAISGAAGLVPTVEAIRAGKDIALANKETLVLAGPLVMDEVRRSGVRLLPVDSEHSAVLQSLSGHRRQDVRRIILTASGGPFLRTPLERLSGVTPEEALRHPKWSMGRKISIDSATLINKGLEVIEARWLFDIDGGAISVAIHPQSIVHSMVEYADGSIISQMSSADMRGPIAYALTFPERVEAGVRPLRLPGLTLEFMEPEAARFPCLALAYDALEAGGTMPAVLNAADEVAVGAFLGGSLAFTGIHDVIAGTMERHATARISTIEDVLEADRWARETAGAAVRAMA